jgi:hypothetical protein
MSEVNPTRATLRLDTAPSVRLTDWCVHQTSPTVTAPAGSITAMFGVHSVVNDARPTKSSSGAQGLRGSVRLA